MWSMCAWLTKMSLTWWAIFAGSLPLSPRSNSRLRRRCRKVGGQGSGPRDRHSPLDSPEQALLSAFCITYQQAAEVPGTSPTLDNAHAHPQPSPFECDPLTQGAGFASSIQKRKLTPLPIDGAPTRPVRNTEPREIERFLCPGAEPSLPLAGPGPSALPLGAPMGEWRGRRNQNACVQSTQCGEDSVGLPTRFSH